MMAVRSERSAWLTRAVADWRSRVGLGHFRRHLVLGPVELDEGLRLLTALFLDPREVPDPKCIELPDELKLTSSRPVHWLRLLLGPRPKIPALYHHAAGVLEAADDDDGEERAQLLPADPLGRRLDQRPLRGELGAVGQRDLLQVGERLGRGRSR